MPAEPKPKDRSIAMPMMEAAINATKEHDNWLHRSAKMKCRTCMWYAQKKETVGRCRRHAPTMSGWPVMFETDWCGDHKLDEDKLGG